MRSDVYIEGFCSWQSINGMASLWMAVVPEFFVHGCHDGLRDVQFLPIVSFRIGMLLTSLAHTECCIGVHPEDTEA